MCSPQTSETWTFSIWSGIGGVKFKFEVGVRTIGHAEVRLLLSASMD